MAPHSDILALSAQAFVSEQEALSRARKHTAYLQGLDAEIKALAQPWVGELRKHQSHAGVETFLKEYGLESEEGVALMCLAEALLRIPDAHTADELIRDRLLHADFVAHLGKSDSFWINASSWGLLLTGRVLEVGEDAGEHLRAKFKRSVSRLGEPVIREAFKAAMRLVGGRFVLGETVDEAIHHAREYEAKGYRISYDVLGEGARTQPQADHYFREYLAAIDAVAPLAKGKLLHEAPSLSVKLSGLSPHYKLTKQEHVFAELLPGLKEILQAAKHAGICISLDAEESTRLDIQLMVFETLLRDEALAGWNGVGFVVQAYNKRALLVVEHLLKLAKETKRQIPVRLVKGAYWDAEIKTAQVQGLPDYPVFTHKAHTDINYLACADFLLRETECFYPQFATHNARTLASVMVMAKHLGIGSQRFEFQRLHGMGEALHDLTLPYVSSRIYAPIGPHKELLAYLIRRLLENGANTSFVHLLLDESLSEDELLADPLSITTAQQQPLPRDIYQPHRLNSQGVDFGNAAQLDALHEDYKELDSRLRGNDALENAADLLEAHRNELVQLLVEEAHKTYVDAVSEVREAADFCRYYAAEAKRLMQPMHLPSPTGESNVLSLHPRGTFVCISPWNFPLAIFIGQVAAALATGNKVIAKPAPQAPRIAVRAVELLHLAGIASERIELVQGGADIGAQLVAREDIAGVVFTGSTATAQKINQTLAARKGPIVPFIAETGGQNCMVIDSSALLEHALDDVLASAFGSAGQRCSALRVLYVQEDIAESFLTLLRDAMQTLTVGDPKALATDIGPVIDADAKARLTSHIERMRREHALIAETPLPASLPALHFVAPIAFEIPSISVLEGENFGPVLHVVRFKRGELQAVADEINSTGYGLTFAIHSRIEAHISFFRERIAAGNVYANRSQIGAVVGVQPFGGEGLSGTGFKAGGPHYLLKFLTERTTTINTAAIGGNVGLLAGRQ